VIFQRFHRHKNLENAILELSQDVCDLKLRIASIQAKIAVKAREEKKEKNFDAELEAIKKQIDGDIVAVFDKEGKLENG